MRGAPVLKRSFVLRPGTSAPADDVAEIPVARASPRPVVVASSIITSVMGPTHRVLGASFGLGYGVWAGLPVVGVLGCGLLGTLTAAGATSPDVDQRRGWRLTDRLTPDELLGRGGPMQHRGITHWWGAALAVTLAWWTALLPLEGDGGRGSLVAHGTGALLAGWWSHLAGDFVFGKADVRSGRGPGIPVLPWWGHVGLALDCGGRLERLTRTGLWLVVMGQVLGDVGLLEPLLAAGRTVVAAR